MPACKILEWGTYSVDQQHHIVGGQRTVFGQELQVQVAAFFQLMYTGSQVIEADIRSYIKDSIFTL